MCSFQIRRLPDSLRPRRVEATAATRVVLVVWKMILLWFILTNSWNQSKNARRAGIYRQDSDAQADFKSSAPGIVGDGEESFRGSDIAIHQRHSRCLDGLIATNAESFAVYRSHQHTSYTRCDVVPDCRIPGCGDLMAVSEDDSIYHVLERGDLLLSQCR